MELPERARILHVAKGNTEKAAYACGFSNGVAWLIAQGPEQARHLEMHLGTMDDGPLLEVACRASSEVFAAHPTVSSYMEPMSDNRELVARLRKIVPYCYDGH